MGQFNAPGVNKTKDAGALAEQLAILIKELDFLNGYIDDKNIKAKSIVAELINVAKLSAISADVGEITAGIITGLFIRTADGTFPRIELSSTDTLLRALGSADNQLRITANYSSNRPALTFLEGTDVTYLKMTLTEFFIVTDSTKDIFISSGKDLYLTADQKTYVDSWADVNSSTDAQTLQAALDAKPAKGITTSEIVGDGAGGTKTLNFTDGVLVSVT